MESPRSNFEEFFLSFVMYCLLCSVRLQFEDLNVNVDFSPVLLSQNPKLVGKKLCLVQVGFLFLRLIYQRVAFASKAVSRLLWLSWSKAG